MKRGNALLVAALTVAGALPAAAAHPPAAAFPQRPVRVIVVSPPGGSPDILTRFICQKFTDAFSQQFIVDNRSGAGGIIGTETAARAAPDGHTLVVGFIGAFAVAPNLHKKLAYDPIRDFQPISLFAKLPNLLAVSPSLPVTSVTQLIDLAKAKPGALNYGSAGNGSAAHLSVEFFKLLTKTDIRHVAYRGTGPALVGLLGGEVLMTITGAPPLMPHIKSGKLRALGVSAAQRISQLPEVPTIIEAGVPGYEVVQWYGLLAPAGTPREIIGRLNSELVNALARPDVRERFSAEGADPVSSTPAQFQDFIKSEILRWRPVVAAFSRSADDHYP
jgi:tripartite-type tricarboxylate transporter receptor subunit TctC